MALAQIITADLHLLSGKVVKGQVDLDLGGARILAFGIPGNQLVQGLQGRLGHILVAAHVRDLFVVTEPLQVIGVGNVAVGRVQLDKAVQRNDGVVVVIVLVVRVGGHQLGPGRPGRVGVLALHLVEQGARGPVILDLERIHRLVVEGFHGAFDVLVLLRARTRGQENDAQDRRQPGEQGKTARRGGIPSPGRKITQTRIHTAGLYHGGTDSVQVRGRRAGRDGCGNSTVMRKRTGGGGRILV